MTGTVGCPGDTCSFEGSIAAVTNHIAENSDAAHSWEVLGYDDADHYRYDAHWEGGRKLQETAQETRDYGEFDTAIEQLEDALYHYQRAKLFSDDTAPIDDQHREVLETINEVKTSKEEQTITNLLDTAENAIDDGDEAHFEADHDSAAQAYEEASLSLQQAMTVATELAPDRVPTIERHLRRVRVRQQSLDLSEAHRTIRGLVTAARDHAAAGDRAFQESEYEVALEEYQNATEQYESLADSFEVFSFDEQTADSTVCDVCRHRFDTELVSWEINLGVSLQVCPSCARFGSDGNLPSPRDVTTEHRAVVENIEHIRDGDVGLEWTSDGTIQADETADGNSGSTERDTQQMLVQLIGVCQQLGHKPTAEKLDEQTDFGYLAYRDEFGSISDALQTAGFDV
ncbi:homing endonuclease associated repeat-containing protein [Halostagnicola bangensis]